MATTRPDVFDEKLFPVNCKMTGVPVKVLRTKNITNKPGERTTPNWRRLTRHMKAQVQAGGKVVLVHRRLKDPLPVKRSVYRDNWQRAAPHCVPCTFITEVVDVEFSKP